MTQNTSRQNAIVVGGGIGGLAAALALVLCHIHGGAQ